MKKIRIFCITSICISLTCLFEAPAFSSKPSNKSAIAQTQQKALPIIGKVISVKGKAWIASDPKEKPKADLQADTVIHSNDLIVTGPDAQVQLVLTTGNEKDVAILLKQDSILRLVQSSSQNWTVELAQGQVLTHVRHEEARKKRFQVKTRAAVLGVRGTTFFVKQIPNQDVYLCTCDGVLSIDNKAIIIGKNHNAPKNIASGKESIATRLKNAAMGNDHSDAEATSLLKLLD